MSAHVPVLRNGQVKPIYFKVLYAPSVIQDLDGDDSGRCCNTTKVA
jgi:hypothetical protein